MSKTFKLDNFFPGTYYNFIDNEETGVVGKKGTGLK